MSLEDLANDWKKRDWTKYRSTSLIRKQLRRQKSHWRTLDINLYLFRCNRYWKASYTTSRTILHSRPDPPNLHMSRLIYSTFISFYGHRTGAKMCGMISLVIAHSRWKGVSDNIFQSNHHFTRVLDSWPWDYIVFVLQWHSKGKYYEC